MASFERAIPLILEHEGDGHGRAVKGDPGGRTRFGITEHTLARAIAAGLHQLPPSVVDLKRDEAALIYRTLWWNPQPYAGLLDDRVAAKILDMDVNIGPHAIRHVQAAINAVVPDAELPCIPNFGPRTLVAANRADPAALLVALGEEQAKHYREWIAADPNPPEREKFRKGLLLRAAWPYPGRSLLTA